VARLVAPMPSPTAATGKGKTTSPLRRGDACLAAELKVLTPARKGYEPGRKRSPTASASGLPGTGEQAHFPIRSTQPAPGAVLKPAPLEDPQVEPSPRGVLP